MTSASSNLCLFLGRHESASSGLWVYGRFLLEALVRERSSQVRVKTVALGGKRALQDDVQSIRSEQAEQGFKSVLLPGGILSRRLSLFSDLFFPVGNAALVHGTANLVPLFGSARKIVTLHDLLQAYPNPTPESAYGRFRACWYRLVFRIMLKRVDLIITDLESTKEQIKQRFSPRAPIEVVYPGLSEHYLKAPMAIREANYARPPHHFLAFASRDPRKNIERVIESFTRLRLEGVLLKLTVVASSDPVAERVYELLGAAGALEDATVLTHVKQDEMPSLYAKHSALIFPSRAEGFGYPVYEALSQGVPVVCRSAVVLGELSRARHLLFDCDPEDGTSVFRACQLLLQSIPSAQEAAEAAKEVRELLDFRIAAKRLLVLYQGVLSQGLAHRTK